MSGKGNAWALRLGQPVFDRNTKAELAFVFYSRAKAEAIYVRDKALLKALEVGMEAKGRERSPWGLVLTGGGVSRVEGDGFSEWAAHGTIVPEFGLKLPLCSVEAVKDVLAHFGDEDRTVEIFGEEAGHGC